MIAEVEKMFDLGNLVIVKENVNAYPNRYGRIVYINCHGMILVQFYNSNGRINYDDYFSIWYNENELEKPKD